MSTGRFAAPGKTRSCPHCRATILDSATVCPGCHHHLRFDPSGAGQRAQDSSTALRVEGTLRHPPGGGAWEYSIVLAIRNDRGEEIARQVVGVGALQPSEARAFSLAVEVFKPAELKEPKPQGADATARSVTGQRVPPDPRAPAPARPGMPGGRPEPAPPLTGRDGQPSPGAVASRPGTVSPRPGAATPRPGSAAPQQSSTPSATHRPSYGSLFKDPRPPAANPGLQPKRR